ncbi:ATP-grasp fold amidoligase family protein, partial [Photobacterium damselae]
KELEKKYNKLIKIKTGEKIDELFYDIIKPSIFIEENLNSLVESDLVDYKFHVFNGEVKFIQLNHRVSMHDYTMTIINKEYKKLPFTLDHTLKSLNEDELCKPFLFEKAIHLAEEIAKDFNYLRVDFYLTDSEVIFGEMTLCPSSGYSKVSPSDWDNKIGSYWNIEKEFFNEPEHSNFLKY